ncbi:MAG: YfhO family protein, partial [bacterium]|nr:YfhO family protein [bacterium]
MLKHGDEKEQYRVSWLLKEKELWLLILINILFFFPVIFLQETFFFRDLLSAYLPRQQAFKELVRFGELPLWDPYIHGGKPFLGNPANSTLNPFNVLYCILPIFRAFNLSIVLHFTSSAVFSYACCRTLRLQPLSSFVGAVVYEFCGCSLSLGNLPGFLLDMPYLPLMLMGWHLLFQEKTTKWFVFTALIGTVQMLSGSHELNMISLLFLLGWSLLCPFPRISIARKIGLWLLLGVFLAGISAIQILPTLEMLSLASKARGINPETALLWSISPLRLPELFFPGFSGEMESITWMDHYWGNQVVDGVIPFILSLYFGFPVFMLAMLGGLVSSKRLSLPLRGRVLLMLTFFIALLFSLGRYVPFTSSLYSFLASFLFSRYPSRILIAGVLPIALLAGFGFEVYSSTVWSRNRRGLLNTLHIVFWTVTAMLVIFTLAFKYSDLFATLFQKVFFHRLIGEHAHQNLIQSFMHGTLACLAATLLFQFRRLQPVRWQPWLLVGIVLVDLLAAGRQLNPSAPELLFSTPPAVGEIRQAIGQGRLFHDT